MSAEFTRVPARVQSWNVLEVKRLEEKMKRGIDKVGGLQVSEGEGLQDLNLLSAQW